MLHTGTCAYDKHCRQDQRVAAYWLEGQTLHSVPGGRVMAEPALLPGRGTPQRKQLMGKARKKKPESVRSGSTFGATSERRAGSRVDPLFINTRYLMHADAYLLCMRS